ncbi:DUF6912 family protein [Nocardiopsis sediminis]|uniref:DUF6912 family protein n=1 Tax=Nocardiopsis sediminis TaxID=1778267 RepID=A0ABV8FHY4_9ACTN
MRIFLPSTFPALAAVLADGEVRGAPLTAYAVSGAPAAGADDEELEYQALRAAADASLRLVAGDPGAPRRRAVIAAEMPEAAVETAPGAATGPGPVTVTGTVPLKRVASIHVDDPDAADDIAAALADPGAGHEDDHELLWYATQELPYLLEPQDAR